VANLRSHKKETMLKDHEIQLSLTEMTVSRHDMKGIAGIFLFSSSFILLNRSLLLLN